jgi:Fur family ferric uptake transcriptional regulator
MRAHASPADPLATRIKAAGLRSTRTRLAVLKVLTDAAPAYEHLSVGEVATRVHAAGTALSVQGAYDCLEALSAARLARRVEPAGSPARYEARVEDNHHHLVCRDCGRTVDVDCVVGAAPCLTPDQQHGFTLDEAEVTFWGRCPPCADRYQRHTEHERPISNRQEVHR